MQRSQEAFAPPEMLEIYRRILARGDCDKGFKHLMGFYMSSPSERAQHIMRCLTDLDALRLRHMDEAGVAMQVLALTSPGVQIMDRDTAVSFAKVANDFWPMQFIATPRALRACSPLRRKTPPRPHGKLSAA